ncbi:MAG: sulfatase [Kiritimatiellae bacterium]|nr:sulfatase [Kiritimatiellia bacterium]MDD5519946.1 sulfatase [Kiritimatiellia bacterium]
MNLHTRRNFLKYIGVGAIAAAAPGWLSRIAAQVVEESAAKPNFVVIFIDDMGYGDIEPYGSKVNRTPNLSRMAAEGMKLTSFYAAPVCTPSRAQIMTGCYAKRVSMPNVIFPSCPTGLSTEEKTVARLLKDRGYSTMCIGKWHLGDQPEFLPTKHGFDHYVGLPYSNDMGGNLEKVVKTASGRVDKRPPLPLLRGEKVVEAPAEQTKLTTLYTEEAVKFIKTNKDKPFFLYMPHTAVHVPINPGKDFAGKSANGRYGDWVEEVDWSVGQVLNTLRDLKLDSKTMVLFTTDNGPWLIMNKDGGVAGPLRGGKGTCWEGGVRVPTIAWWPGRIAAGSSCNAMMSEMDVLPTLVKLAGGEVPKDKVIDGKDIWPLLSGKSKESPHEELFFFTGVRLDGVRSGQWKLLVVRQGDGKTRAAKKKAVPQPPYTPELFNLDADIGETTDVAAQNPDVVKRLQELIAKMDADLGVKSIGPGVRPGGIVKDPKPLLRDSREYN